MNEIRDLNGVAQSTASRQARALGTYRFGYGALWMSAFVTLLAFALSGCANTTLGGLQVVPSEQVHEVVLLKPINFAASSVGGSSIHWYHGLMPGRYKLEARDEIGDFYVGEKDSLVFGASRTKDGNIDEPRTSGGFWLARNSDARPMLKLFRINPSHERRSAGLVVDAINQFAGLQTLGLRSWIWQFVPIVHHEDDVDRLQEAARKPK